MTLETRKATRYQDLAKARAEIARLFPLAMEVIEGVLKNKKSPRNLRFEAAKLIYYHHAGKPPTMLDVQFDGEVTSLSQADKLARASAEARKAFQEALAKADGLSVLDDFKVPTLAGARPGLKDQTSVRPEPTTIDLDSLFQSDVTPLGKDARTYTRAQGGTGAGAGGGASEGGLNAVDEQKNSPEKDQPDLG